MQPTSSPFHPDRALLQRLARPELPVGASDENTRLMASVTTLQDQADQHDQDYAALSHEVLKLEAERGADLQTIAGLRAEVRLLTAERDSLADHNERLRTQLAATARAASMAATPAWSQHAFFTEAAGHEAAL